MKYDLEKYFTFIHCGGSVFGKGKFLRNFIEDKKLELKNVVYIGDEVRDIDTAKEAGVKVISVEWGYNSKRVLKKNEPDALIQEPDDLLKVIEFVYD
jgi:phosphoglycolate phosphatase-like HAD superfamily hydrolase